MRDGERLLAGCIAATVIGIAAIVTRDEHVEAPTPTVVMATATIEATPKPPVLGGGAIVDGMPAELWAALRRYADPADIDQWRVILACETTGYDNFKPGRAGELSVVQALPSTLAGVGLTAADVTAYTGAMRAGVLIADEAYRQRGDKFWPWTTRGGC